MAAATHRPVTEPPDPNPPPPPVDLEEGIELAWAIISSAFDGAWDMASPTWREAAEAWRNVYIFKTGRVAGAPTVLDQPPSVLPPEPPPRPLIRSSSQGTPKLGAYEQPGPIRGEHPSRRPDGQWAGR